MSSPRSPIVAGLLAIALVTTVVPFLPASAADGRNLETCQVHEDEISLILQEEGYAGISHPLSNNARVSQALYFHVFGEQDVNVLEDSMQTYTNGQDAYVIHLDCQTDGNEYYCIEHQEPAPDEGFPILRQLDGSVPDVRIQFYSASENPVGDERNPEPGREERVCEHGSTAVPASAHYAVVYLRDGTVEGVQTDHDLAGPYTMKFNFELHRS